MQVLSVIRRRTDTFSDEEFAPLLEPEAQALRQRYIEGTVRSIWSRNDKPGAVVLFEVNSVDEARAIIETFPLTQRGMLEVEALIPLRGYRGFAPRS
jgi:muconolactone delta-isomerase